MNQDKQSEVIEPLLVEWERLEQAFHDAVPDQGETGDGGVAGKALCQFLYDNAPTFREALSRPSPSTPSDNVAGRVEISPDDPLWSKVSPKVSPEASARIDEMERANAVAAATAGNLLLGTSIPSEGVIERLQKALEPFAAMGRVMETRARVTFGKMPPDGEIVCESSGEAGFGILTMGHFRDAAALLPDAPGWGGMYIKPFEREALARLSPLPLVEDKA